MASVHPHGFGAVEYLKVHEAMLVDVECHLAALQAFDGRQHAAFFIACGNGLRASNQVASRLTGMAAMPQPAGRMTPELSANAGPSKSKIDAI